VSFRAIAWLWGLHFFRESPRLTAEVFSRALKYLYLHARHLETYLSTYFSPNTHLTGEALGLFYLGLMLPEFHRARHWRALGWKILIDELDRHVRPDGVYFEQASYYHRYTTDFYMHLLALMRRNGWPRETYLEEKLTSLLDHLMHLIRPDGTTPLVGDDDGGRLVKLDGREADDFRAVLATGAALFGRGDYKHVAGEAAEETLWLLGPEGVREFDRVPCGMPTHLSLAFTDGGYYLLRDGWERRSNYLLIDCGPHGALGCGHAHADALSFELVAGGASWLVDPGTYTYTGDAGLRDKFRSTAAHNTATVDGQSQSVPAGPFSWGRVARASEREFITGKNFDYFVGEHDGYQRLDDPVTHARSVLFVKADEALAMPGYVVVRDSFAARAAHNYALHYHFDSDCRLLASYRDRLRVTRTGGDELLLHWRGTAELQARFEEGRVSRCYGQQQAAPVLICEANAEGTQSFITCLLPVPAGRSGATAEIEPGEVNIAGDSCLRVQSGRGADVVLMDLMGMGEARLESYGLAACGEMAWARTVDERIVSMGLVRGRSMECADGFAFNAPAVVRHCAIERRDDEIEITLEGAQCFHLVLAEQVSCVIINGARLGLNPDWRRAGFVKGSSGWRLSELDC
jgi:hypothetical protein